MAVESETAHTRTSVLLNEKQVAEMLCVSLPTLRRWRHRRVGPPYIKLSALCRYPLDQLEAWLAGLKQ
jgi:predicted DNA-binding transcriptional regulator AlpA